MDYDQLVTKSVQNGQLSNRLLISAFKAIRREHFLSKENRQRAGQDRPLPIGHEQTNSQPSTVMFMLELLDVQEGQHVLDVGCGSGWSSGLLGYAVGSEGNVVGTERIKQLAHTARLNIQNFGMPHVTIEHTPDALGFHEHAPYDRILVSAGAQEVPQILLEQLRVGGSMVIPVGNSIHKLTKTETDILQEEHQGFIFVPLISGD